LCEEAFCEGFGVGVRPGKQECELRCYCIIRAYTVGVEKLLKFCFGIGGSVEGGVKRVDFLGDGSVWEMCGDVGG